MLAAHWHMLAAYWYVLAAHWHVLAAYWYVLAAHWHVLALQINFSEGRTKGSFFSLLNIEGLMKAELIFSSCKQNKNHCRTAFE